MKAIQFNKNKIFFLILASVAAEQPILAKQDKLGPAKADSTNASNQDFINCRKTALRQLKIGKSNPQKFETALSVCRERFPGSALYIDCKKSALKKNNKNKNLLKKELSECKKLLVATTPTPKFDHPFFINQKKIFFGGIGLNDEIPFNKLKLPNFDCNPLRDVARAPKTASYILFGNHPKTFSAFSQMDARTLSESLKFVKPRKDGHFIPELGKVFGNPKNDKAALYFPTAPCHFNGQLDKRYSGLSSYYLLDVASNMAHPYFGIAYYNKEYQKPLTKRVTNSLLKQLGASYKKFAKSDRVHFLAQSEPKETDLEGDPKNLCKKPLKNQMITIIQSNQADKKKLDYVLVANIKNLCAFGETLTKRYVY